MQQSLVIKQGAQGQVNVQGGLVPMTVSSSPASMSNVMTLNKAQNVVASQNMTAGQQTIIPNVQILNMRPGAPGVSAAKSVATVSPRVVIGSPQVVGARAAAPGITLQTLQGLQAGQQGHLLLKTENGQYQLLRVGPAPSTVGAAPTQAIRISTVPAHPGVATVTTGVASASSLHPAPAPPAAPPAQSAPPAPSAQAQKPSDNTKEKCRNFLANLLELSSKEPKTVERSVRGLIQELIDARVEPDEFCDRLERLLNASPQPCLIGFLKKSLPLLRQSMVNKELVIDGINPPTPHQAYGTPPAPTLHMQKIITAAKVGTSGQKSSSGVQILESVPIQQKLKVTKPGVPVTKISGPRAAPPAVSASGPPGRSLIRERDKKSFAGFSQNIVDDKMGEDDINDVAAMGGVNLAEESQRILGSTEMIGAQIRSCKDETLVSSWALSPRIRSALAAHALHDHAPDLPALLSHALHAALRDLLQRLTLSATHRADPSTDNRYEVTQDVKGQLKFLEELDRVEKKRTEDSEREILLRAAKSRSKNEDPEQLKLKAKAKEMQRAELEELRQREANLTALHAIGPRKKPRLDAPAPQESVVHNPLGRSQTALRSRLRRVTLRDLLFLMEHDADTARSHMLYKAYLRSRSD